MMNGNLNGMMNTNWNNTAPAGSLITQLDNDAFLQGMSNTLGATNNHVNFNGTFNNQANNYNQQLLGNNLMMQPGNGMMMGGNFDNQHNLQNEFNVTSSSQQPSNVMTNTSAGQQQKDAKKEKKREPEKS